MDLKEYHSACLKFAEAKETANCLIQKLERYMHRWKDWEAPEFPGFYGNLSDGTLVQCERDRQIPLDYIPTAESIHLATSKAIDLRQKCEQLFNRLHPSDQLAARSLPVCHLNAGASS